MDELGTLLKAQRRRLVAHLAHGLGLAHLGLAEDAVQAASLRALEVWPVEGRPANPAGWLFRTARHHAIDQLRRAGRDDELPPNDSGTPAALTVQAPTGRLAGELDDEELALLFAACHPRLPAATQVALALRALGGLGLATIADGLFCSDAALPSAWYADWLQYRRVATLGASLPVASDAQQQQARTLLAAAGAPHAASMLLGFVPPLAGLLMWGVVSDYEEDVRYRVRQAVALDDLRARVAAYVAENKVPPQTLQDVGATFVPNSEVSHLELKGAVIELVLGVSGAADRRVRWRLDPDRGWVCEARDLQVQYTPPGCKPAQ